MIEGLRKLLGALGFGSNGDKAGRGRSEAIPCEQALEHLFEYLDGELEGETKEEVERHFEICRRCYPRLRFEQSFTAALQRVRAGQNAPPELRDKVLELLEDEGGRRN